jgi:phage-related protein
MTSDNQPPKKQRYFEISKAVRKELESLPASVRNQFLVALEQISWGLNPGLIVAPLSNTVGKGILELKINGKPAYRLVYTLNFPGKVVVLAARPKTTNGVDKQLVEVAASRLKSYSS